MTFEKEIKDLMYSRGYDLHYSNGKTSFTFSKYYDRFLKSLRDISDVYFSIGCTVNTDGVFEFVFIAKCWNFQFKSSEMSPITREDFDKIEKSFAHYCRALNSDNPF